MVREYLSRLLRQQLADVDGSLDASTTHFGNCRNLTGSNQRFITRALPHLDALLAPSEAEATRDAELVVLGHVRRPGDSGFVPAPGQRVLDLARSG